MLDVNDGFHIGQVAKSLEDVGFRTLSDVEEGIIEVVAASGDQFCLVYTTPEHSQEIIASEEYAEWCKSMLAEQQGEEEPDTITLNREDAETVMSVLGLCARDKDCYRIFGNIAQVFGEDYDYERFTIGEDAAGEPAVVPAED